LLCFSIRADYMPKTLLAILLTIGAVGIVAAGAEIFATLARY